MSEKYIIYDNVIAEEGQVLFTVSKPYVNGTVLVYLNGLLTKSGIDNDYTEEDETHIKFNYELAKDDKIAIISLVSVEGVAIQVISNREIDPNSIYKKYGEVDKLKNNNEYNVSVKVKNKSYEWKFTSTYNPAYTTAKKIRIDTGDLLNNITCEKINYLIYLNSKEIDMIYIIYNKENQTSDIITPSVIMQWKEAWVRYKTDLDLLNAAYISLSNVNNGITKKIGDIEISKTCEVPLLTELQNRFMLLFQKYDEFIKNESSTANLAKANPNNERMGS